MFSLFYVKNSRNIMNRKSKKRGVGYTRPDLGVYIRSRWEANYFRILQHQKTQGIIQDFQYEPLTFWFESIKRGTRHYTPDFLVVLPDGTHYFVEIKGFMDTVSNTKLKRMAKYYPNEQIIVIDEEVYRKIEKEWREKVDVWE